MEKKATTSLRFMNKKFVFYSICSIFLLFLVGGLLSTVNSKTHFVDNTFVGRSNLYFKEYEKPYQKINGLERNRGGTSLSLVTKRRLLSWPGSSPPRCWSKCGRCKPCKPIHVPVPPGTPVTAEYYPEAWRCKCGNRLYMP